LPNRDIAQNCSTSGFEIAKLNPLVPPQRVQSAYRDKRPVQRQI
jgi:hypothetical protein